MVEPSSGRPRIVMTLMVRDEDDIVAAMIEHHLAQGVDLVIATDNASTDRTREILAEYEAAGRLELHDYPHTDKRQAKIVTGMVDRAVRVHGADWVVNADADEFWVARGGATLREAIEALPPDVRSMRVPVVNMMGPPIANGSVLTVFTQRDERLVGDLEAVGLHAHPTHDLLIRGELGVEIAQGNHFSSLPVAKMTLEDSPIEVLHFPYRAWPRYAQRVRNTGLAYDSNPEATPSPLHHGMRDWRWLQAGALQPIFVARHPEHEDAPGFRRDTRIRDGLRDLLERGAAVLPDELALALREPQTMADAAAQRSAFAEYGRAHVALERRRAEEVGILLQQRDDARTKIGQAEVARDEAGRERDEFLRQATEKQAQLLEVMQQAHEMRTEFQRQLKEAHEAEATLSRRAGWRRGKNSGPS